MDRFGVRSSEADRHWESLEFRRSIEPRQCVLAGFSILF